MKHLPPAALLCLIYSRRRRRRIAKPFFSLLSSYKRLLPTCNRKRYFGEGGIKVFTIQLGSIFMYCMFLRRLACWGTKWNIANRHAMFLKRNWGNKEFLIFRAWKLKVHWFREKKIFSFPFHIRPTVRKEKEEKNLFTQHHIFYIRQKRGGGKRQFNFWQAFLSSSSLKKKKTDLSSPHGTRIAE